MKKPLKMNWIFILAAVLLVLIGCALAMSKQESPTPAPTLEELQQMYAQAAEATRGLKDFSMEVTTDRQTAVNGHTFTETTVQQLSFLLYGQDTMQASVKEEHRIGDHTTSITEDYAGGLGAVLLNSQGFTAEITPQDYAKRFAPAVLLNEKLYKNIALEERDGQKIFTFSDASLTESWTGIKNYRMQEAKGTAKVNAEGQLTESSYFVTYLTGTTTVKLQITVKLEPSVPTLPVFPDTAQYTALADLDAPKLLEQATGYLLQASSVTSVSTEKIDCQAGALYREQVSYLDLFREASDLNAQLIRNIQLTDGSRGGVTTTDSQTEKFLDSVYTITANDGAPTTQDTITAQHMLTYCQDFLVATILLPKYMTGVTVTDEGDTYRYTFTTSAALSDVLMANACKALYDDPNILNKLADDYWVNDTSCYLTIHKETGLPTAAGLYYSGTHVIAGFDCQLIYQLDQVYDLTSGSAYETITGQPYPDTQVPETT